MLYAVDFDGTLCANAWPDIGEPNIAFIRHFRELREQGHKLILWTCREGEALQRAIDWCADYGLGFDAHNENLPELTELYGNDCRKIGADFYVDDKSYWPIGKESKMNADEVVSALRCCNRSKGHRCSVCPVFSRYEHRICKATVDRFAADLIESLQATNKNLRNELCQRCGRYREAHIGACDGCRWRENAGEVERDE